MAETQNTSWMRGVSLAYEAGGPDVNVHPCILQRRKLLRKYCDGPCRNDAGDSRRWAPTMRPVLMLHSPGLSSTNKTSIGAASVPIDSTISPSSPAGQSRRSSESENSLGVTHTLLRLRDMHSGYEHAVIENLLPDGETPIASPNASCTFRLNTVSLPDIQWVDPSALLYFRLGEFAADAQLSGPFM